MVIAFRRFLLRLLSFFRSGRADAELAREIGEHLRLLEDQFIAEGLSPHDARFAARRAFGGVEQAKERQRDARSFRWLTGWWLELKLGGRMLIKYPGLTLVGGAAMAFAIAVGTAGFEVLTQMTDPRLPLPEGDRIVGIRLWHAASNSVEGRALHDFTAWREQLASVEDLGAFQDLERNLTTETGIAEPIRVAEISASAFQLARVPPLLGRVLIQADEQPAAPPVVVIGYDLWQARFSGDPTVIGRTVRLGRAHSTIVGVMPEGFAFPLNHRLWAPLRASALDYTRRQGPRIRVFGRLAPGVTLEQAQAELSTLGTRAAANFPDTHAHLRPEVMPYAQSMTGVRGRDSLALMSINLVLVMLLVLVCGNVALLMFARAATRESEIVVRSALGASRGRIILQLFAEALVLGAVASVAGLGAASLLLQWWLRVSAIDGGTRPFWFSDSLAPETVLYACGLTLLGALVAGVVPALKVTGRRVEARLRQGTAGGGSLRFGGLWTVVIVTQVAGTVTFPAAAFFVRRHVAQIQSLDIGFPAAEYLSARLEPDLASSEASDIASAADTSSTSSAARAADTANNADSADTAGASSVAESRTAALARFRATSEELERRLSSEPDVTGVTFTNRLPRTVHSQRWIETDAGDDETTGTKAARVNIASVAANYFQVLDAPMLSGRTFHAGDLATDATTYAATGAAARVVIVNASFVRQVLGGRHPVGRRVRYLPTDQNAAGAAGTPIGQPEPWHEIVGVVRDLGTIHDDPRDLAGIYHPLAPGATFPIHIAAHVRRDPVAFAPRLRAIAAAVDPTLRLHELRPLDDVGANLWNEFDFLFRLLILWCAIAMLLSLAGIYAIMSFAVSRRTREIGIRLALGADARRIAAAIFARPLAHVGLGVIAGGGLVAIMSMFVLGPLSARETALVAAYAALMMAMCLLACVVPTRRALRVEPTEVLGTK